MPNIPEMSVAGAHAPAFHQQKFIPLTQEAEESSGTEDMLAPLKKHKQMGLHADYHNIPHSPAMSMVSTHCGGSPAMRTLTTPLSSCVSGDFKLERADRTLSNMSHFELVQGIPREVSETTTKDELSTSTEEIALKAEPPIRRPKVKGEAQPQAVVCPKKFCEKTQKIIDEAHHFGLCDHYAKLMDTAKEIGFKNVRWPTNFTLFHLAAKKNNKEFIEWLVRNDFDDLHTIDDFGKKPIDYACSKKRDSVHGVLDAMMKCVTAEDTAQERKYQAIKSGTWVDPARIEKMKQKKMNCMEAVLQSADIAEGDVPSVKPASMMSAYEAETIVPIEYKKCFKAMANGGWQAMEGKWPNQGQSVLHWAARNGKEELCHFLVLEYGADPHEEDGSGHDSMYHAKLKRHRKLAKKLLLKFKEPKAKGKKK